MDHDLERQGLAWQTGVWDQMSDVYAREIDQRFAPVVAAVLARANLVPGERALDLGTGTGAVAEPAARAVGPRGEVVGIDISAAMLALARQRAEALGLANFAMRRAAAKRCRRRTTPLMWCWPPSVSCMSSIAPRQCGRSRGCCGQAAAGRGGVGRAGACDIVRFQQIAGSFAPPPPVPGVGPGALADPSPLLGQLEAAGIDARVETEILGFDFPSFNAAWEALAGVTTAQLEPEQRGSPGRGPRRPVPGRRRPAPLPQHDAVRARHAPPVAMADNTGGATQQRADATLRCPSVRSELTDARPAQAPPPRRADRRLAGGPRSRRTTSTAIWRPSSTSASCASGRGSCYAERGRPSIDPVVFFKLQLVMFFEGIRSERQLIETASLNLAHRWYLGYALDEDAARPLQPDPHPPAAWASTSSSASSSRSSTSARRPGLVWGRELYFDATKVEANADLDSLVPRFYYEATAHVAELFADDAPASWPRLSQSSGADDLPAWRRPAAESIETPAESPVADPPWRLLEERRLDPHRAAPGATERTSDLAREHDRPRCHADAHRAGTALGYHDHYVVDGGKRRIILAALVTPGRCDGERADARPALAGLLPAQAPAAPGHRRHHLRHGREHRRHRGRGHPGLRAAP